MHYDTESNGHGLRHDPFKALVAPRPIGWIATLAPDGTPNLAPYSFFNSIADKPPMIMFASSGRKDSLENLERSGEFTCSLATWDLREAMNMTSAAVPPDVDEFRLAGLQAAPSRYVKPPRVARSPAALECRLWKTLQLPAPAAHPHSGYWLVLGTVVGIYIDDAAIRDGRFDTAAVRPLARMGYMDYAVVTPETTFEMKRPQVADDGRSVVVDTGAWDGVYR
jgi:flavin reductase (DIM6/NTAB) family NADH-FMN oxidoreductase RutF